MNTDNKLNIGDVWKSIDSIKINVNDVWKDVNTAYININDTWKEFWTSAAPPVNARGCFAGGLSATNVIQYITINTPSNGTDFGDLTVSCGYHRGTSNGTNERGVFFSGWYYSGSKTFTNVIDYITINSTGNATDFGDLSETLEEQSTLSNGENERGMTLAGKQSNGSNNYDIYYITINSTGNSTDFGYDFGKTVIGDSGLSNATNERGILAGDTTQGGYIYYLTINSPSNSTSFGYLSGDGGILRVSSTSNGENERGIISGGYNYGYKKLIQYITINSPGNATDFGNLIYPEIDSSSTSNKTSERGIIGGGGAYDYQLIQYITINSTGNSTDFGDLIGSVYGRGACSNA